MKTFVTRALYVITTLSLVAIGALGYQILAKNSLIESLSSSGLSTHSELEAVRKTLEENEVTLSEKESALTEKDKTLSETTSALALAEENASELKRLLDEEKDRNEKFEDQISDMSKTVGKLDKLSRLDPELLMKYSKVYFLNEHYAPPVFEEIPSEFVRDEGETERLDGRVLPFLTDLLEDAREDDISLLVVSAFRSFEEQKSLKSAYTTSYGSGANAFSADQGYSEHQLGTTVDFTTSGVGGGLSGFDTTPAYTWLLENAYRYGFVLSYPKDNGYYIFEPWHWRFVGEDLARHLHRKDLHFYDLDQRAIDTYLIDIFD